MRWTCPKCGKKLDVSNEQLIANDGVIVCPQCLLQAHLPLPKARVKPRSAEPTRRQQPSISFDDESDMPPVHKQTSTTPPPPPHKPHMKQASTSYRYTGLTGSSGNNTSTTRKKTSATRKKSRKKKKNSDGMSALGCLGRTIVFTLVLFAAYVFLGLLIDAMQ